MSIEMYPRRRLHSLPGPGRVVGSSPSGNLDLTRHSVACLRVSLTAAISYQTRHTFCLAASILGRAHLRLMISTPIEELNKQLRRVAALGRPIEVQPGMPPGEIDLVERRIGTLLPLSIRDLFRATAGLTIPGVLALDFRGSIPFTHRAFPAALPIAAGGDRTWIIDFAEDGSCPVLLVSRNPHVVIVQASLFGTFIAQCFETGGPWRLIQPHVKEILARNPYAALSQDLMNVGDTVLRTFANTLNKGYLVTDLRGARAGIGFTWRNGAIQRAGNASVFAVPSRWAWLGSWFRRRV